MLVQTNHFTISSVAVANHAPIVLNSAQTRTGDAGIGKHACRHFIHLYACVKRVLMCQCPPKHSVGNETENESWHTRDLKEDIFKDNLKVLIKKTTGLKKEMTTF